MLQTTKASEISTGMNEGKLFAGSDQQNGTTLQMTAKPVNGLSNGQQNWAYQHDTTDSDSDVGSRGDDAITGQLQHTDEEKGMTCGSGTTHSIILDISTTNFVDMVTVKTLKNVGVPGPVPHKFVWDNTFVLMCIIFRNTSAFVMFYSFRYSETLDRLIWMSIYRAAKVSGSPHKTDTH